MDDEDDLGEVRNSLPDADAVEAALDAYTEKEAAKSAEGELTGEDAAMVEEEKTPDQG